MKKEDEYIFYVYAWYRISTGEIFYIGKGKHDRAFTLKGRNEYFTKYYNKHKADVAVKFLTCGISEDTAFALEKWYIDFYLLLGQCQTNIHEGGKGGNTFKYLSDEDLNEIKLKISKHSKEKWKNPSIRNNILTNQKIAMSSLEVKQKISNNTKKAMSTKDVREKILRRATKIKVILPNKEEIEFETTTQFNEYCKRNYNSIIRYNIVHYNGDYYLKDNSLDTLKPFTGWTIISIDKNEIVHKTVIYDKPIRSS